MRQSGIVRIVLATFCLVLTFGQFGQAQPIPPIDTTRLDNQSLKEVSVEPANSQAIQQNADAMAKLPLIEERITVIKEDITDLKSDIKDIEHWQWGMILAGLTIAAGLWFSVRKEIRDQRRELKKQVQMGKDELSTYFDQHFKQKEQEFRDTLQKIGDELIKSRGIHDLVLTGKVLYLSSKFVECIEPLNAVLEVEPNNAEARKYRGLCYKRMGKQYISDVIRDLLIAAESEEFKNDSEVHEGLANAYLHGRYWEETIQAIKRAQETGCTRDEELQRWRGNALIGLGKDQEAIAVFDAAIEKNPMATKVISDKIHFLMRNEEYDQAIEECTTAIKNRRHVSDYFVYRARAYFKRGQSGDWRRMIADFNQAEEISPSGWDMWFYRGVAYKEAAIKNRESDTLAFNQYIEKAIKNFQTGIRLSKKSGAPRFRNELCWTYILIRNEQMALEEANKSVEASPHHAKNNMTLVATHLAFKNWPNAVESADGGLEHGEYPPGKIWLLFMKSLAKIFQHFKVAQIQSELVEFVKQFRLAQRYFEIEAWDWSPVRESISNEISSLDPGSQDLIADLQSVLARDIDIEVFAQKWTTENNT